MLRSWQKTDQMTEKIEKYCDRLCVYLVMYRKWTIYNWISIRISDSTACTWWTMSMHIAQCTIAHPYSVTASNLFARVLCVIDYYARNKRMIHLCERLNDKSYRSNLWAIKWIRWHRMKLQRFVWKRIIRFQWKKWAKQSISCNSAFRLTNRNMLHVSQSQS